MAASALDVQRASLGAAPHVELQPSCCSAELTEAVVWGASAE
jgi:hypothetical protein